MIGALKRIKAELLMQLVSEVLTERFDLEIPEPVLMTAAQTTVAVN